MNSSRIAGVVLLMLLLAPQFAVAASTTATTTASTTSPLTVGIAAGDSAVYSYDILTTYPLINGNNYTVSNINNQITLSILAVSTSLGEVEYSSTIDVFNSTTLTSGVYSAQGTVETVAPAVNVTSFFNPYVNDTYLCNLGFNAFTYTDIWNGTAKNLQVSASITGMPGYSTITVQPQLVNASVVRTPEAIYIDYRIVPHDEPADHVAMVFDPTTGLLQSWVERATVYNYEKVFTYKLISFSKPPVSYAYLLWDALLAIMLAVVAVIVAHEVASRGTRHERKAARLKKKLKSD